MNITQSFSKLPERCPTCTSSLLVRRGTRKKKFESVQLWLCKSCGHTFTPEWLQGKSYPTRLIVDALCWYEQGYSMKETQRQIKRKYNSSPSENTVYAWLSEHKDLCTYHRFRMSIRKTLRPNQVIRSVKLYHQQVYKYSIHRGKLGLLEKFKNEQLLYKPLNAYLEKMLNDCPHKLFLDNAKGHRASKAGVTCDLSGVSVVEKQNNAVDMTRFVLSTVANNRLRHESLQRFMLSCDLATIATEIPIYLLPEDIKAFEKLGFSVPIENRQPITGHIDFLQVRNGLIHILDYKPDARTTRPIEQLTLYALALSKATGLRLYNFKCAWFNEEGYYEFFPLRVVHKKK